MCIMSRYPTVLSCVFIALLASCGKGAGPGSTSDPNDVIGTFDSVDSSGHGTGWALAPMIGGHPLESAVFCDGDAQTGTLIFTVRANRTRDDVAAATGVAGEHG